MTLQYGEGEGKNQQLGLKKTSAATGKFLIDTKHDFILEAYTNGTPGVRRTRVSRGWAAPTVVTKEVDMAAVGPFLFAEPT